MGAGAQKLFFFGGGGVGWGRKGSRGWRNGGFNLLPHYYSLPIDANICLKLYISYIFGFAKKSEKNRKKLEWLKQSLRLTHVIIIYTILVKVCTRWWFYQQLTMVLTIFQGKKLSIHLVLFYSPCCYSNPDHYSNTLVIIAFEIHEQYTWLPTYSSWLVSCLAFSCNHVNNFQQKRHNTIELILHWWHRRAWCAFDAVLE